MKEIIMSQILNYAVPVKHVANDSVDSMDRGVWLDYLTKPKQVSLG